MKIIITLFLFLSVNQMALANPVYKWKDKKGNVVYSESIPENLDLSIEVEILETGKRITTIQAPQRIHFRERKKQYGIVKEMKAKRRHSSCDYWESRVQWLNKELRKSNPVNRVNALKGERYEVKSKINRHC